MLLTGRSHRSRLRCASGFKEQLVLVVLEVTSMPWSVMSVMKNGGKAVMISMGDLQDPDIPSTIGLRKMVGIYI